LFQRKECHLLVYRFTKCATEEVALHAWCVLNRFCVNCVAASDAMAHATPELLDFVRSVPQVKSDFRIMLLIGLHKSPLARQQLLQHGWVFLAHTILLRELEQMEATSEPIEGSWAGVFLYNISLWRELAKAYLDAHGLEALERLLVVARRFEDTQGAMRSVMALVILVPENHMTSALAKLDGLCLATFVVDQLTQALLGNVITASYNFKTTSTVAGIRRFINVVDATLAVEALARHTAQHGALLGLKVLDRLSECLDHTSVDPATQALVLERTSKALWNLTFSEDGRHALQQHSVALAKVQELASKTEDPRVRRNCEGIFFQLKDKHQAVEECDKSRCGRHIMLSYCWAQQSFMVWLRTQLKDRGFPVWIGACTITNGPSQLYGAPRLIPPSFSVCFSLCLSLSPTLLCKSDIDHMSGSTLEAMAAAVEQASVVVMCVSAEYKDSAACRTEA
jgi:hypothetical protein